MNRFKTLLPDRSYQIWGVIVDTLIHLGFKIEKFSFSPEQIFIKTTPKQEFQIVVDEEFLFDMDGENFSVALYKAGQLIDRKVSLKEFSVLGEISNFYLEALTA